MEKVKTIATALIAIKKRNKQSVESVNAVLSDYASTILARQGLSLPNRNYSLISIILESEANTINSFAGKIGKIPYVSIKVSMIKDL
jgi:putative iron-only hydrogenase system regulator